MQPNQNEWNIAEVRRLVRDLFEYSSVTYWTDFLLSVCFMWGSFAIASLSPIDSLTFAMALTISVFAGYRAVLFVHEIAHFKQDTLPGFAVTWNLICGIPMCVPSFMYRGSHNDHHSKLIYGTKDDGEYVPFARESRKRILLYLFTPIVSPLLLPLRFAVLAPASWIVPGFRRVVVTQLSSLVIDFEYSRNEPSAAEKTDWRWQEPLTVAYTWAVITGFAIGAIPVQFLFVWYLMAFFIFLINSVRTIAAHRYALPGDVVSVGEQYLDSVNIVGQTPISVLLCPVGLRFHALHHLFPTMPYHSLADAHNRLVMELPADSPYHFANERSIGTAVSKLWLAASNAKPQTKTADDATSLLPSFFGRKRSSPRESRVPRTGLGK